MVNFFYFAIVYLRCVGGEVGATSSLAPKIGPLGLVSFYLIIKETLIEIGCIFF